MKCNEESCTSEGGDIMRVIFYGAGQFAAANLSKWVDGGLSPSCFADVDERKHHTMFCGYSVLPLREALANGTNYVIYPTVSKGSLLAVTQYLLNYGVPQEKIKYMIPMELRRGCSFLGNALKLYGEYNMACHFPQGERLQSLGNFVDDYVAYQEYCTQLADDLRNGNPCSCDG